MHRSINTLYTLNEHAWTLFLKSNYPNATLMRWTPYHRVYLFQNQQNSRVLKVERQIEDSNIETLTEEYVVHQRLSGTCLDLKPLLRLDQRGWTVLEMDYVDGLTLTQHFRKGSASLFDIFKAIALLLLASARGIQYRQFRPRHIIKSQSEQIFFIDFGKSSIGHPLSALIKNFSMITVGASGRHLGAIPSLFYLYMKQFRCVNKKQIIGSNDAMNRVMTINDRNEKNGPSGLRYQHVRNVEIDLIEEFEKKAIDAVRNDPTLASDFYELKLLNYGIPGPQDFGFIWHYLTDKVNIAEFHFCDWYGCQGIAATFAALKGASVTYWEPNREIANAHRLFAQAFGISECAITYDNKLFMDEKPLMVFLLSRRPASFESFDFENLTQRKNIIMICAPEYQQGIYDKLQKIFKLRAEVVNSFNGHLFSIVTGSIK
jgi:predicted Ser/Thr protein kinase